MYDTRDPENPREWFGGPGLLGGGGPSSRGVMRVWGNWGEYMLDPKWRAWGMEGLGIGEVSIVVDLFATPWTAAAPLYITKEMNSFAYDWGRLCAAQEDSLL